MEGGDVKEEKEEGKIKVAFKGTQLSPIFKNIKKLLFALEYQV